MRTHLLSLALLALALAALAPAAHAGSIGLVSWTDQGVGFDLEVFDDGAGTVSAALDVTSDDGGDYLKNVAIKIFSSYVAPDSVTGPAGHTWSAINGARSGNGGAINSVGSGFVGIDASDFGPLMDLSVYSFTWQWSTTLDPIGEWSIKAWTNETATGDFDKSRQWSSGGLTPNVPEPPPSSSSDRGWPWAPPCAAGARRPRRRRARSRPYRTARAARGSGAKIPRTDIVRAISSFRSEPDA